MNYKKLLSLVMLATGMITMVSCSNGNNGTPQCQENHKYQVEKVTDYLYYTTLDYDFDYSKAYTMNLVFRHIVNILDYTVSKVI